MYVAKNIRKAVKEVLEAITKIRGWPWILCGVLCGVLLLVISGLSSSGDSSERAEDTETKTLDLNAYIEESEHRIKQIVEALGGVQNAEVFVTLDSGSEYIYAQKTTSSSNESSEAQKSQSGSRDYVLTDSEGNKIPILVKEVYPKIRGVAVVCSGGDNAEIQKRIIDLLAASLGLTSTKIFVGGR